MVNYLHDNDYFFTSQRLIRHSYRREEYRNLRIFSTVLTLILDD
jgi:hypothetical protein